MPFLHFLGPLRVRSQCPPREVDLENVAIDARGRLTDQRPALECRPDMLVPGFVHVLGKQRWFDEEDASVGDMTTQAGEPLPKCRVIGEVAHRTEQAGHDIEALVEFQVQDVRDMKLDVGKRIPCECDHVLGTVHPHDRSMPREKRQVDTGPASGIKQATGPLRQAVVTPVPGEMLDLFRGRTPSSRVDRVIPAGDPPIRKVVVE